MRAGHRKWGAGSDLLRSPITSVAVTLTYLMPTGKLEAMDGCVMLLNSAELATEIM
jgi:hypothetical protein